MGGRGNGRVVVDVIEEIMKLPQFKPYFKEFAFPYGFLGVDEYSALLNDAGFIGQRIELFEKDMIHDGKAGLSGWIRTTWLPYTQRVPEQQRELFIDLIASRYLERVPLDDDGQAHVDMVRLEVEAKKPGRYETHKTQRR
jgi:trans-aconitate methyltransferase